MIGAGPGGGGGGATEELQIVAELPDSSTLETDASFDECCCCVDVLVLVDVPAFSSLSTSSCKGGAVRSSLTRRGKERREERGRRKGEVPI